MTVRAAPPDERSPGGPMEDSASAPSLGRLGVDRLRDHAALAELDVVLATAPDRVARHVHQVLLIEELAGDGGRWSPWTGRCRPRPTYAAPSPAQCPDDWPPHRSPASPEIIRPRSGSLCWPGRPLAVLTD
jgi:hypothetical protein